MGYEDLDPFAGEAASASPPSPATNGQSPRERAVAIAAATGMSLGMPSAGPPDPGPPPGEPDLDFATFVPAEQPAAPTPGPFEATTHLGEWEKPDPRRLLPATQYAMAEIAPPEWVRIGRFLQTIIHREALQHPSYSELRLLISTFVAELFMEARAKGEPMPEATPDEIVEYEQALDKLLAASSRERRVARGRQAGIL